MISQNILLGPKAIGEASNVAIGGPASLLTFQDYSVPRESCGFEGSLMFQTFLISYFNFMFVLSKLRSHSSKILGKKVKSVNYIEYQALLYLWSTPLLTGANWIEWHCSMGSVPSFYWYNWHITLCSSKVFQCIDLIHLNISVWLLP